MAQHRAAVAAIAQAEAAVMTAMATADVTKTNFNAGKTRRPKGRRFFGLSNCLFLVRLVKFSAAFLNIASNNPNSPATVNFKLSQHSICFGKFLNRPPAQNDNAAIRKETQASISRKPFNKDFGKERIYGAG
jgi:hypothetical protein